jgi:hypothetical protein
MSSLCVPSRISASIYRNAFLGLLGAFLLLTPVGARADIYHVTLINVTFTATCLGGGATCTEVVNGFGDYNSATDVAFNLSVNLTGSLNASLNAYGTPVCTAPGCLGSNVLYDPNTVPGLNPIEFNPDIPMQGFNAPTPQPLIGGPNGTLLFVPGMCGGDQPPGVCGSIGTFPGNGMISYQLTSGTYTSVDLSVPEPDSAILVVTGILGLLTQRGYRKFL